MGWGGVGWGGVGWGGVGWGGVGWGGVGWGGVGWGGVGWGGVGWGGVGWGGVGWGGVGWGGVGWGGVGWGGVGWVWGKRKRLRLPETIHMRCSLDGLFGVSTFHVFHRVQGRKSQGLGLKWPEVTKGYRSLLHVYFKFTIFLPSNKHKHNVQMLKRKNTSEHVAFFTEVSLC